MADMMSLGGWVWWVWLVSVACAVLGQVGHWNEVSVARKMGVAGGGVACDVLEVKQDTGVLVKGNGWVWLGKWVWLVGVWIVMCWRSSRTQERREASGCGWYVYMGTCG